MALRIVRAEGENGVVRPLRLWYSGRRSEALAALVGSEGGSDADELGQLVELALEHDLAHASLIGDALLSWDDESAAYRVLKRSCERLLDDLKPLGAEDWLGSAVALVQLGLPWLSRQPHEPIIMNYVGVALYGLNEPALAIRLFEAVQRLDPTTENVRGNLEAARKRLRRPVRLTLRSSLAIALRALRPSLEHVAKRARTQPAAGSISLCMIVRDEEEMLAACLESCREAVSEMIVVDTGSSDRTVEIAESFGARVLHFEWTGNFAEARNVGVDAATGDWILWLDADEQLEPGDAPRLVELTREPWREAHWLVETNYTGQNEAGTASQHLALRLWRNRPHYRFSRAIHEQIRNSMPYDLTERFGPPALRIRHYGYLKNRIDERDKHQRNLELLHGELEANPRAAFTHFNIGTEYVGMDDLASARRHYELGLRAAPRGARLVGARVRADPRLAPLRRAPLDRRSRRLRGACERAARALPGLHRPRLRARAGRTGPRGARTGGRPLRAVPRDGRRAAPLLGRGRPRLVPGARSAGARRDEPRPRRRGSGLVRAVARAVPGVPRRRSRPDGPLAVPARCRSRRRARAPRGVRARRADVVPVPRHRLLRARTRRARREPPASLPRDRRRACRGARRAARGARDPAPVHRGRERGRRSRRGHAAVRRSAASADARSDAAGRSGERRGRARGARRGRGRRRRGRHAARGRGGGARRQRAAGALAALGAACARAAERACAPRRVRRVRERRTAWWSRPSAIRARRRC